jgi:hypothetical protein
MFKLTMKRTALRTVGIIAVTLMLLGIGVVSVSADGPPPPHLDVKITTHSPSVSGDGFDAILYVSVPPQKPSGSNSPDRYDLTQSFVVQSIDLTETAPDGTSTTSTLITCTLSSSPAYPSRNTVSTCTGTFASRVMSYAYPGSETGIYFSGFGPASTGHWTYTFSVTGLYDSSPTTLTSRVSVDAKP